MQNELFQTGRPPEVRAITIQQPWAWAIVAGLKRFENRSWRTHYRGRVLIHAGKGLQHVAAIEQLQRDGFACPSLEQLPLGAIVGEVELIDCRPVEACDDYFATGPWCHVYENAVAYDRPFACNGALSYWKPAPAMLARK